jgi:MarR-like DNA-binding transcriptional regulator SgrR of sgrS sRNA
MWCKQNIKIWVIGALFLWLLSALMPAVSVYIFQEADQISMTGTLEEEQQQEEKKEENKKEWICYYILINPNTITAASLTHSSVVKKTYNSPANVVVLPPPELV